MNVEELAADFWRDGYLVLENASAMSSKSRER